MSDSEINLVLAKHFGWKCTEHHYPSGVGWKLIKPDGTPHGASLCFNDKDAPWQFGPDFIHDPAMRDLLQQRLLSEGWEIILKQYPDERISVRMLCSDPDNGLIEFMDTRERIWALAAHRALVEGR